MRWTKMSPAIILALALLGCGKSGTHEYPPAYQAEFNQHCPADNPMCACMWEEITKAMTAEDYQAATERFRAEGLMHHKITRARTLCRERHPG